MRNVVAFNGCLAVSAALLASIALSSHAGEASLTRHSLSNQATPTPGKVYVRNTLDGEPFIRVVTPLGEALVGGEPCYQEVLTIVYETIMQSTFWPWDDEPPCNQPGEPAQICYNISVICTDEFVFMGDDITLDVEWGALVPDGSEIRHVRVRFEHDGTPQPVTLIDWLFTSGTLGCSFGSTEPINLSSVVLGWPPVPREECKEEGVKIDALFTTKEFGELEASFTWLGDSLTLGVDTGASLATPTPSPSPTPVTTETPAALPSTGGPP